MKKKMFRSFPTFPLKLYDNTFIRHILWLKKTHIPLIVGEKKISPHPVPFH